MSTATRRLEYDPIVHANLTDVDLSRMNVDGASLQKANLIVRGPPIRAGWRRHPLKNS